jgi:hypothetical protein
VFRTNQSLVFSETFAAVKSVVVLYEGTPGNPPAPISPKKSPPGTLADKSAPDPTSLSFTCHHAAVTGITVTVVVALQRCTPPIITLAVIVTEGVVIAKAFAVVV